MNTKLKEVLEWANHHQVNLDSAYIDPCNRAISFWHTREAAENFRAVKRAIGGFEKAGDPPHVSLRKKRSIMEVEDADLWTFNWYGTYVCEAVTPKYNCVVAEFEKGGQFTEEEMFDEN